MSLDEKHEMSVTHAENGSQTGSEHVHKGRVAHTHADGTVDYVAEEIIGGDSEGLPKGYYTSAAFIGTVVATCTASICAYLGWVLPANTLLLINEDIGPSPNITWVGTVWTLGSSIGFLLFGRLSDIFGRKELVLAVNVLGLVGCIVGGTAQGVGQLIGANACNGIAAAGQLSFQVVLGELVPNKMRGPIVSLCFLSSLPFAVFGPVIARSLILNTGQGWRWSYYMGVILEVVTLVLYQFLYHPPRFDQLHESKTRMQQFKELDFGGIVLFISGFVIFIIGLSWGGQAYPWASAHVIATMVVGGLLIVAFGVYETYIFKGQALMPPRLFKNLGYVCVVTCASIGAMVYYSLTIIWPTIVGTLFATDVMEIGWKSCVVGGGILLGQLIGGVYLAFGPKVKWMTILSSAAGGALTASLAAVSPGGESAAIAQGILALLFIGIVENITFPGVTLLVKDQDIGVAAGVLGSIRGMAGAIAQALYVSILTNKSSQYLARYVPAAATEAGLAPDAVPAVFEGIAAGSFADVPGITTQIIAAVGGAVQRAYTDAFYWTFIAAIPFGIILFIASLGVPNLEIYNTQNVAKLLQGRGSKPIDEETPAAEKA